jgi:hypothetical protein
MSFGVALHHLEVSVVKVALGAISHRAESSPPYSVQA